MSGGNLVYMRTLVDTPAGGVSMFCAHVTSYGRGHDVGLTTRDADLSAIPLPDSAGSPVTYRASKLAGDITTRQSADASGGKGFVAPPPDGELTVVDGDGKIAQDIGGGHFVPVGWDVWAAEYDVDFPSIPKNLVQLQVVDYSVAAGVVRFALRSPSYLTNPPLHGTRTLTQLATDPVDSGNPTDPTYLAQSVATQFVGLAMGSIPVSLKAPPALPALVVARYAETTLKQGDIGYGATSTANTVALKANLIHYPGTPTPEGTSLAVAESFIEFYCRDSTEMARLNAEMASIVAAGYRLVVSDGSWFASLSDSMKSPAWENAFYAVGSVVRYTVRVNLDHTAGDSMFPKAEIDPTQVSLFAAPTSVAISRDQCILDGFARNQATTEIGGAQTYDGSAQVLAPFISSESDFIGFRPITDVGIGFSMDMPPGSNLGAVEIVLGLISSVTDFSTSNGSINSIVQDPAIGWNGGAVPVSIIDDVPISQTESHPLVFRIRAKPMKATLDADFFVMDTTYVVSMVSGSSGPTSFPILLRVCGVFEPTSGNPYGDIYALSVTAHGQTVTAAHTAARSISRIDWRRKVDSIQEMSDNLAPRFELGANTGNPAVGDTCIIASVTAKIMETFVWAFQKFGFASIHSTVYPFWTTERLAALATDGAGTVVAGGAGVTTVAAGGAQNWSASPIIAPSGSAAVISGGAYGAGKFVFVGWDPITGLPGSWSSATGAEGSWTYYALTSSTADIPTRIRFVGTKFVVLYASGKIQTSTDGTTWTAAVTVIGGIEIYDIAFDGTNYLIFGPSGHVYKSTNLTAWTDITSAGVDRTVYCAVWTGLNFVALGEGTHAFVASTTDALAGSWTQFAAGAAGPVEDATWNGLDIVATGPAGIRRSPDGATWTNEVPDAFTGVTFGTYPYNTGAVWTGAAWVVGAQGSIWTWSLDKGHATWIPWFAATPDHALKQIRGRFMGGMHFDTQNGATTIWNPLRWTGGRSAATPWGIAFDPPENAESGTTATAGARKICEEWWFQAGEMPETVLDGSSDQIEIALPEINLGNIEDVATLITVQFQPFGGEYLGKAYIQNVDVDRATAGKPDSFFFAGWDATGNTHGLAIWTACRNAYLKTGALRSISLTYDSVHDPDTLGTLWTTVDADLGTRIDWLCERPQYLKVMVYGNTSKAATAYCGARYKPNFAMLNARGMSALNATGYGVVVSCDHNFTTGEHALELAFPPA